MTREYAFSQNLLICARAFQFDIKVRMDTYTKLFADKLKDGADLNAALANLREAGASPVDAIKAIRQILGVSLGDAKRTFSVCPAWEREVKAADELHSILIAALDDESRE